jgi:hypothetical protein
LASAQQWRIRLLGIFGLSANAVIFLLIPLKCIEMHIGVGWIGVLVGVKAAAEVVFAGLFNAVIARVGSRDSFRVGCAGVCLTAGLMCAATSVPSMLVLQVCVGAARGLGWVASQAYVTGMERASGRPTETVAFSFFATVGQFVAPVLAGVVAERASAGAAFLVLSVLSACAFLLSLGLPHAPGARRHPGETVDGRVGSWRLLSRGGVQAYLSFSFVMLWILASWGPVYPILLLQAGLGPGHAGAALSIMSLGGIAASLATVWMLRWVSPTVVLCGALTFGLVGLATSPILAVTEGWAVPAIIVGISQGGALPLMLRCARLVVPTTSLHVLLTMRSVSNQAASAVAPPIMTGLISLWDPRLALVASALFGLVLMVLAVRPMAAATGPDASRMRPAP